MIAAVLLVLFRDLMHVRDPFAAAPRLCERMPSSHETHGDAWRRFDVERGFVELGPFDRKTPRKIIIVARFDTPDEASSFMHQIAEAVPVAAQLRITPDAETYRGVIIERRTMSGLEIANSDCFVVITLIADGPRTIVPYTSSE